VRTAPDVTGASTLHARAMNQRSLSPARARHTLGLLGEFVYLVDAFLFGLLAAIVVIGGINPLESAKLTGVIAATIVIAAIHHVWYVRNRSEIEHDPGRLTTRERRGF
jgi:hypothetical protein